MRVYIDTSVIGGCLDEEFKEDSIRLFDEFIRGVKILVISDILLLELEKAPTKIRDILKNVPDDNIEYVSLSGESIKIANVYIKEGAVTQENLMDARHIAIATVNKVDILVSWNFKHIVNIRRIHLFNSVI